VVGYLRFETFCPFFQGSMNLRTGLPVFRRRTDRLSYNVGKYQSMLQNIPVLLDCLSFESELIGYPETSVVD
jgi:hypothetical protein